MLQRFADTAAVEAEIERMRALSGDGLRRRWQSLFGRPPPDSLTPDLLRRMIANRVQEQGSGTRDRAALKSLDGSWRGVTAPAEASGATSSLGTVLVRDHGGRRRCTKSDRLERRRADGCAIRRQRLFFSLSMRSRRRWSAGRSLQRGLRRYRAPGQAGR